MYKLKGYLRKTLLKLCWTELSVETRWTNIRNILKVYQRNSCAKEYELPETVIDLFVSGFFPGLSCSSLTFLSIGICKT